MWRVTLDLGSRGFSRVQICLSFCRLTRQTALGVERRRKIPDQDLQQDVSRCLIIQEGSPLIEEENLSELPGAPLDTTVDTYELLRLLLLARLSVRLPSRSLS